MEFLPDFFKDISVLYPFCMVMTDLFLIIVVKIK